MSSKRRVVVTGIGLATPIGHDLPSVSAALQSGQHGIVHHEWEGIGGLLTGLAGPVRGLDFKRRWDRKHTRTMGGVAKLAAHAADAAIADAGLPAERLRQTDVGLAFGSTHGSSHELERFCRKVFGEDRIDGVRSSDYLHFMSHTTSANLAGLYGVRGRVVSTCAACVSASQGIGAGYEAIQLGSETIMICGGADELHWVPVGVFDILGATSRGFNDAPDRSPRPFDAERDGLVVSEGSGALVLEELEHARGRGATIYAEILGYGTNCDGAHVTQPQAEGMADAMRRALRDAELTPAEIDYVNAHATATLVGDAAEAHATAEVIGDQIPISSTKGHTGHTLGACGAIEAAFCVAMMQDGFLAPTRNLERPDPALPPLRHVTEVEAAEVVTAMTNNFAFGGINTSLVLRRGDRID